MTKQTFKNVKFVHCRNRDALGSIMPNGGLTIAFVTDADFKVVGYAAARCAPIDMFNKQIGRMKSSGRLLSDKWYQEVGGIDQKDFVQKAHEGYYAKF
jgi:hypothetical protein